MLRCIDNEEWYPVKILSEDLMESYYCEVVDVSKDFLDRYNKVMKAMEALQEELANIENAQEMLVYNVTDSTRPFTSNNQLLITEPGFSINKTTYPEAAKDLEEHNEKWRLKRGKEA